MQGVHVVHESSAAVDSDLGPHLVFQSLAICGASHLPAYVPAPVMPDSLHKADKAAVYKSLGQLWPFARSNIHAVVCS